MSRHITIKVSEQVVRQATQVAARTDRTVEEVLASWLEVHQMIYILQELLAAKSDDAGGRSEFYNAIVVKNLRDSFLRSLHPDIKPAISEATANELREVMSCYENYAKEAIIRQMEELHRELLRRELLPVAELSDGEVLALTEFRLTDEEQAALDDLLARNREGALDAEGQKQLDELMRLYEHGLLRKSQALRVAVQRELIEPLQA